MDLKQLGYYIWMDEQEKDEEKRKQEERELLEYYKYLHRIQKEDEEEQITVFGKYVYIFTSGRCGSEAGESKNIYILHNWRVAAALLQHRPDLLCSCSRIMNIFKN